ncbi:condensation domain-containing protein, partial [Clostridium sp. HBUAS56017]|uniref:condensation domain-containing protein n=1 Tax=Clostridium sp. HBUAS56017 TaxID=2571128 RepID=UPI001FA9AFC4
MEEMDKYISENNITILWVTVSLFNFMSNERPHMFKNIRYLLTGGDKSSTNHMNRVIRECKDLKIIHAYGPTENTTFSTTFLIDREYSSNIPIGKPISNSKVYIINNNKIQPIGVCGELCVAGDGLARGYLNKPELTKEKFVDNPLVKGERIYKTGDLARILPDGNIEFLGRIDSQVKIRGFRIELGEVENAILSNKKIKEVVVVAKEDKNGNKYLCAYIVSNEKVVVGEIKEYLLKDLPQYMIPAYFVQLEKLPLNLNGKVDKKSLPEPDVIVEVGTKYIAPRNKVEEKLADIWEKVLHIQRVGVKDNFFDVGGHSLNLTMLMTSIHKKFEVNISISQLFKLTTIEEQSKYIEKSSKMVYTEIEKVEEREYYPLSSAQKRMYILHEANENELNYNVPNSMILIGELDKERLNETFKKLIIRHKSLRTSFEILDGEVVQKICEDFEFNIENYEVKDESEVEAIVSSFVRPFNLSEAPLIRVGLIKVEDTKHILMIDMHHIICDGVSMGIIIDEIGRIYQGEDLEELPIQYVDYAVWQNKNKEEINKKQKNYWLERFLGEIPVLNFPTDYVRPAVQSFEGETLSFSLDKNIKQKLNKIAEENNATLYMVLLSIYNVLLHKYTGQEDIIIGSPVAGRTHGDLEKVVGMFVNTLAMRNKPTGEKTFK